MYPVTPKAPSADFGIMSIVRDDNHSYLNDLQTQKKRLYFPTNADTSKEFSNIVFPATTYLK